MSLKHMLKYIKIIVIAVVLMTLALASIFVFFDQVVLVRKHTIFHVNTDQKVVALTFDDGPSPEWTPQILDK